MTTAPLPPHNNTDTSLAAAESMRGRARTDENRVRSAFQAYGPDGLTADEVQDLLSLSHQNGSARVSTLARRGEIVDSGRRRKTRTGRTARVYVWAGSQG